MNTQATTILDLDALMDQSMDTVEAAPDYVIPPAGQYVLSVENVEIKQKDSKKPEGGKYARIQLTYKIEGIVQTSEMAPAVGSMFSDSFMADEEGLKYFKRQAQNILNMKALGQIKLGELMTGLKGAAFKAQITIRQTKDQATGKVYENISVRAYHDTPAA